MKRIEKFIFVGVGLGLHIKSIDKKIAAKEYLIVEDDLELFRLSLFTLEYYELAKRSKLYFSVADDENIFIETMKAYLHNTFFNNRYLKYSYITSHSEDKLKQIQNTLATQSFAFFPYKQELKKYLRPLEYINDGYKVMNVNKHFSESLFNKRPVLLLAAGPSFQRNIAWVKENHHKFIIVAIAAVLNTLYEHNIKPDIMTHIDGYEGSLPLFEDIPTKEFLKDTIIMFGPFALSKLRDFFTKEQVFYHEANTAYFDNFGTLTGPCVGSHSLMMTLLFNSHELYLLGLNLALDQETGSSHSEDYVDKKTIDMSQKNKLQTNMNSSENLFPVKGNFRDIVFTTAVTHSSVQFIHENIGKIKLQTQLVYNLNDGAALAQTVPLKIESIDINRYEDIDKKKLNKHLYQEFSMQSRLELNISEVDSLKKRLESSKQIRVYISEYIYSVSYTNSDKYLYDMLGIVSKILHTGDGKEIDNLVSVYYSYFEYVLPLIVDILNTRNLKNEKRHLKKLDKMLQNGMLNIEKLYEDTLENFIQTRT